jgi:hypothetical protein
MLDSDLEFAGVVALVLRELMLPEEARIWWVEEIGVGHLVWMRWEGC